MTTLLRQFHIDEDRYRCIPPETMREVLEFRCFICGQGAADPSAFVAMSAQWIAPRLYEGPTAAELAKLGATTLAQLGQTICLNAEMPPREQVALDARLQLVFDIDPERERDEDEKRAWDDATPWEQDLAAMAFMVAKDGPGVLDLPPWAYKALVQLRQVEAMRDQDQRNDAAAQARTQRIATSLGLTPAPD